MLTLIQLINHMSTTLEYTDDEIASYFESILQGDLSLEDLMNSVNVETPKAFILNIAKEKLPRWKDALEFVKLRNG